MKKILYIQGYQDNGCSRPYLSKTYTWLQNNIKDAIVYSPTYNQNNPFYGMVEIEDFIKESVDNGFDMVIGSSLGGWYAMNIASKYSVPCILINPLTEETILPTLSKISNCNSICFNYSKYMESHPLFHDVKVNDKKTIFGSWDPLEEGLISYLIWSDNDEVVDKVDNKCMPDTLFYNIKTLKVIPTGKHRLSEQEMKEYLKPAIEFMNNLSMNDYYSNTPIYMYEEINRLCK